jgi:hypothetical protein
MAKDSALIHRLINAPTSFIKLWVKASNVSNREYYYYGKMGHHFAIVNVVMRG